MIELVEILPVLMELQTLGDRTLRKLAALHIVQDVRRMNMKHRNESKNRALQNIMFQLLQVLYVNVLRPFFLLNISYEVL